jgi:hypothetical protein
MQQSIPSDPKNYHKAKDYHDFRKEKKQACKTMHEWSILSTKPVKPPEPLRGGGADSAAESNNRSREDMHIYRLNSLQELVG